MRINASRLLNYRLPLNQVWRTNRGELRERSGWIVELATDSGLLGLGDCAPLPDAGTETASAANTWLARQLPRLRNCSPTEALQRLPSDNRAPAAHHALETALLDLLSQAGHVSLRRWLSPSAIDEISVNGAAGGLDEQLFERVEALLAQGYETVKLKVGVFDVPLEIDRLQRLAARLPTNIRLRLDANGAWNLASAQEFLRRISGLPIESLEEPLRAPHLDDLYELQRSTEIPLALDESIARLSRDRLIEHPPVRRLIIKPSVLGGLLPAKRLADSAAQAGMESIVTSTLESSVGVRAAAQLAMAIDPPSSPQAHGLATAEWFSYDLAEPIATQQGRLRLSDLDGLGARLLPAFLELHPTH
ncbi:MAG: o-succinylbenzoate synthase [Gammaproteobacteria bacterium]|nr:o-succinylbenzoate synthase [Gammaproteobacteria bacterium]